MIRAFAAGLVLILSGPGISIAAEQVIPGTYKSWSEAQRDQAANKLKQICTARCQQYTDRVQAGGQRATYEAAACVSACFHNRLPKDYPGLTDIKRTAEQNYAQAKKLGSNVPTFLVE